MSNQEGKPFVSTVLVIVQFVAILVAYLIGDPSPDSYTLFVLSLLGLALIVWAVMTMRRNFRVYPEVRKGNKLVIEGPFKRLRHPVYSGVLLMTGAWIFAQPSPEGLALWLILLVDLLIKLEREEKYLMHHFPRYKEYKKDTYRLIPFVY